MKVCLWFVWGFFVMFFYFPHTLMKALASLLPAPGWQIGSGACEQCYIHCL